MIMPVCIMFALIIAWPCKTRGL